MNPFFNHGLEVPRAKRVIAVVYRKSADTSARIFTMEMGFEGLCVTDIGSKAV